MLQDGQRHGVREKYLHHAVLRPDDPHEHAGDDGPKPNGVAERGLGMIHEGGMAARLEAPRLFSGQLPNLDRYLVEAAIYMNDYLNTTATTAKAHFNSPYEIILGDYRRPKPSPLCSPDFGMENSSTGRSPSRALLLPLQKEEPFAELRANRQFVRPDERHAARYLGGGRHADHCGGGKRGGGRWTRDVGRRLGGQFPAASAAGAAVVTDAAGAMGGLIDANADIMPEIKRRVRLAWACYSRFKRELYDIEAALSTLKLRMLKAEVMETLLYECVT